MENKTVNLQTLSKNLETVMIPAKSSNVVAFGYNQKTETVWVLFKGNALYAYKGSKDLPLYDTFIEGINAESKGKWVNSSLVNNKQLSIEAYEIK